METAMSLQFWLGRYSRACFSKEFKFLKFSIFLVSHDIFDKNFTKVLRTRKNGCLTTHDAKTQLVSAMTRAMKLHSTFFCSLLAHYKLEIIIEISSIFIHSYIFTRFDQQLLEYLLRIELNVKVTNWEQYWWSVKWWPADHFCAFW